MSIRGRIYNNGRLAGFLSRKGDEYIFVYDDAYFNDPAAQPVSLTLPKTRKEYRSMALFPFFYGLLAEGVNKEIQCRKLKIDENDHFTRLLKTAGHDVIGSITVEEEI